MSNTINNRTPEEIKKGLELCCVARCSECPYSEECDEHPACGGDMLPADVVLNDIAALIQQLERERDAAVEELKVYKFCTACKHDKNNLDANKSSPCFGCSSKSNWQWRGVREE